MSELPAYPVWSGDPALAPGEPSEAYFWNGDEWVLVLPYLTASGAEVGDPTPMEPPLGYMKQPTLTDQIRMMVLSEKLRDAAMNSGYESFDEADDFEIGDDFDPSSPWENEFDPDFTEIRNEVERLRVKGVAVPEDVSELLEGADKEPVRQDPQPQKAEKKSAKSKEDEGAD